MSSPRSARAGRRSCRPTTVYGLCSEPSEEAVARLYEVKGRQADQPTALLGRDVDALLALVPELRGRTEALLRAVLPGPFTIVAPNPARRLPWLAGRNADANGLRVPDGPEALMRVLEHVPVVAATSANLPADATRAARGTYRTATVRSSTAATCPGCRPPS